MYKWNYQNKRKGALCLPKQTFDQIDAFQWVASVQVATVWTSPDSSREIDTFGISTPTDIDRWIETLSYEDKLALCEDNRVQTQVLYGEQVYVTEIKGEWAHVVIPSQPSYKDKRGYPGWIPIHQLKQVDRSLWDQKKSAMVIKDKSWLTYESKNHDFKLSYLTTLPVHDMYEDRVQVQTPHGKGYLDLSDVHIFSTSDGLEQGTGKSIVKAVEAYTGLNYFWGGMSSFGYDCSGLAYAAHKANGYLIARDAGDQANDGIEVRVDELQPGDLLFFAYQEGSGTIHHVGIYYGDGKMLHSPQTGKGTEIIAIKDTKYEKELCTARRYWLNTEENHNG